MEFLKNIQWYHVAILCLISVILFLIIMDCGCSKSSCQAAVKAHESFAESEGRGKPEDKSKPELVLYHASSCGYCKQMMPEWDKFAEKSNASNSGLNVTKYECDGADKQVCDANNIQAYPTVVLKLPNGKVVPFEGERSEQGLMNFINRNTA